MPIDWLGVAPFFLFALLFLILPTLYLVLGAFLTPAGEFTFDNIRRLFQPKILAPTGSRIKSASLPRIRGALIGLASPGPSCSAGCPAGSAPRS